MIKLAIKNCNRILKKKHQKSGKIHKYEYLAGEKILPSDQSRIIEQEKVIYSSLGKAFEKQAKTIEGQEKKQTQGIEDNKKQLQLSS